MVYSCSVVLDLCWNRKIISGTKACPNTSQHVLTTWRKDIEHSLHSESYNECIFMRGINKQGSSATVCMETILVSSLWITTVAIDAVITIPLSNSLMIIWLPT